jgi:hypothetical protein
MTKYGYDQLDRLVSFRAYRWGVAGGRRRHHHPGRNRQRGAARRHSLTARLPSVDRGQHRPPSTFRQSLPRCYHATQSRVNLRQRLTIRVALLQHPCGTAPTAIFATAIPAATSVNLHGRFKSCHPDLDATRRVELSRPGWRGEGERGWLPEWQSSCRLPRGGRGRRRRGCRRRRAT